MSIFGVLFALFCVFNMIIKISNLNNGDHHLTYEELVKKIGLEEPFFGNFLLNLYLQKSNSQIVLDSELILKAEFVCDRCTESYKTEIESKFQIIFLFGNEPEETESLNIKYLAYDAEKIDIGQELLDYAMLSVPMRKLCSEECKGLCYKCGTNLNESKCSCENEEVDARWLPLMELKNKLNNN
jgi:Predicted metal-binding, possibly nucleic acid-binding protein